MIESSSLFPQFFFNDKNVKESIELKIFVLTKEEASSHADFSQKNKKCFGKEQITSKYKENYRQVFLSPRKCASFKIQDSCEVTFSNSIQKLQDFYGIASDLLLSAYKFSRKTQKPHQIKILIRNKEILMAPILQLVEARNHSRELASGRGDVEGIPEYFVKQVLRIKNEYDCQATIYKGEQLLKEGFRLLHAVGRASSNEPVFANITYRGNKKSDKFVAFVGKGVCFDAGGLDIKSPHAMRQMFLDKQGACSVLAAFEQIVQEKLPVNLTCSIGLVENFLGPNAYRPSDIIKSRKGLTVKIDDTDAQGRLVLVDAMNWTQERYKTEALIELSTLTYSNIMALGQKYAGLFSNSTELSDKLFMIGKRVHQHVWRMPVDIQHHEALEIEEADVLSDNSSQWAPGGSIGAAFLQKFVEKDTKWVHLDIGGVGFTKQVGSGWGAMILVQYMRHIAQLNTQV